MGNKVHTLLVKWCKDSMFRGWHIWWIARKEENTSVLHIALWSYRQVGELAMIPSKDAKELLYKLFSEFFITLQVTLPNIWQVFLSYVKIHKCTKVSFVSMCQCFEYKVHEACFKCNHWHDHKQKVLSLGMSTSISIDISISISSYNKWKNKRNLLWACSISSRNNWYFLVFFFI